MLSLAEESASRFRKRFSGREATVLWEQLTPDGLWSGITGNYIRVFKKSDKSLGNRLTSVKLT
jgi:threonylcarbamoyladenosine tRNA methylthiotransferase MtaB